MDSSFAQLSAAVTDHRLTAYPSLPRRPDGATPCRSSANRTS